MQTRGKDGVLGCQIQSIRKAKKLTQQEVAQAAGVSQTLVSRLENGDLNIRTPNVRKVVRALKCELVVSFVKNSSNKKERGS